MPETTFLAHHVEATPLSMGVQHAIEKIVEAVSLVKTEAEARVAINKVIQLVNEGHAALAFRTDGKGVPDIVVCGIIILYDALGEEADDLHGHYLAVAGEPTIRGGGLQFTVLDLGTEALEVLKVVVHVVPKEADLAAAVTARATSGASSLAGVSRSAGTAVSCSRGIILPQPVAVQVYEAMANTGTEPMGLPGVLFYEAIVDLGDVDTDHPEAWNQVLAACTGTTVRGADDDPTPMQVTTFATRVSAAIDQVIRARVLALCPGAAPAHPPASPGPAAVSVALIESMVAAQVTQAESMRQSSVALTDLVHKAVGPPKKAKEETALETHADALFARAGVADWAGLWAAIPVLQQLARAPLARRLKKLDEAVFAEFLVVTGGKAFGLTTLGVKPFALEMAISGKDLTGPPNDFNSICGPVAMATSLDLSIAQSAVAAELMTLRDGQAAPQPETVLRLTKMLNKMVASIKNFQSVQIALAATLSLWRVLRPGDDLTTALQECYTNFMAVDFALADAFEDDPALKFQVLAYVQLSMARFTQRKSEGRRYSLQHVKRKLWDDVEYGLSADWKCAVVRKMQQQYKPSIPSADHLADAERRARDAEKRLADARREERQPPSTPRGGGGTPRDDGPPSTPASDKGVKQFHPDHSTNASELPGYMKEYKALLQRMKKTSGWLKELIPLPTERKESFLTRFPEYPLGDDGQPLCFSYHVRATCFDNCRCATDHQRRNHSAAEQTKAKKFLNDVIQLLN